MAAKVSADGQAVFHYVGPTPLLHCYTVTFPQANWFNSRYGQPNKFSAAWANSSIVDGDVLYVGHVSNGQVDVTVDGSGHEQDMREGGQAFNPWNKTTTHGGGKYYYVDTYMLSSGSCEGSSFEPGCSDYTIIDSRGSGGEPGTISPPGSAIDTAVENLTRSQSIEIDPNLYPAVGIIPTLKQILRALSRSSSGGSGAIQAIRDALNGVGALARVGWIGAYHDSVILGEISLRQMIQQVATDCGPSLKALLLVGYSQGAQVAADVYQSLPARLRQHITGVVLFGDPRYNHNSFADTYKRDNNGILTVRGEFPASSRGKVLSYCHARDPVCQGLGQFVLHLAGAHNNYDKLGEPEAAVRYFLAHN